MVSLGVGDDGGRLDEHERGLSAIDFGAETASNWHCSRFFLPLRTGFSGPPISKRTGWA